MNRKTVYCAILALIFAVSLAAGVFAQTVSFQSSIGGSARYGLLDDNGTSQYKNPLLFSLMGSRLFIVDISTINVPVEIGSLALPGIARRIAQSGDMLYITCTHGGLVAVDVSNPSKPDRKAVVIFDNDTTRTIGQTFGVTVKGDYVYVADYSGVFVLDKNDLDNNIKTVVGEFHGFDAEHPNPYDAYIDNSTGTDMLYISCEGNGLYILDVSDKASPLKLGQSPGQYYCSLRDGDYMYVAAGGKGLDILDVSDPDNITLVGNIENNYGGVLSFAKYGDYVYMSSEFEDFYKINVKDPAKPVQEQQFLLGGNHSLGVSVTYPYVVLANSNHGIRIFDIRSDTIQQVGEFLSMGRVVDCRGAGDFAYAAVGLKGLAILDMTNPLKPLQVSQTTLSGYANGVAVAGTAVYVAEANNAGRGGLLEIVDATDPEVPVITGSVALDGEPYSVQVQGNLAIVACQTMGLALVDITDAANPQVLSTYNTPGLCYAPLAWNNYILAADGLKGFTVLDIRDTEFPKKVADSYNLGYNFGNVIDIAFWDTWMYLPASEALHIAHFDPLYLPVSDNTSYIDPITRRYLTGQVKAVAAFDGYLLVADSVGGVRLFDIAKPKEPQESDNESYSVTDPLRINYAADQGLAYVPSGIGGLYVFKVNVPEKPEIDSNGIWVGEGKAKSDNASIGFSADLYQAHKNVTGTLTVYADEELQGTVTAAADDNESSLTGTIAFEGGETGTFALEKKSTSLAGTITIGDMEVMKVSLAFATDRGNLAYKNISALMDSAFTSAIEEEKGAKKRHLRRAKRMMKKALEQSELSSQFKLSAVALARTGIGPEAGALAASEVMLYQSAQWETLVAQAEATIMATTICADYQRFSNLFLSLGDRALARGMQAGESGQLARALYSFGTAIQHYSRVAAYYDKKVGNCPTWGEGVFNGYYEGVIDFGFIAAVFKVCPIQAEDGSITGTVRIDIEASNEHMSGRIADAADLADTDPETGVCPSDEENICSPAKNTTKVVSGNDESTITGTMLLFVGDITAHIEIVDWKYNISTDQWEGQAEVKEQTVIGNVTLKKVGDVCPEGFPGE
jgi:hypothetical protein